MAFNYKQNGMQCGVSDTNLKLSLLMYCSYFVLFARFFYDAYVLKNERKQLSQAKSTEDLKNNEEEKVDAKKTE